MFPPQPWQVLPIRASFPQSWSSAQPQGGLDPIGPGPGSCPPIPAPALGRHSSGNRLCQVRWGTSHQLPSGIRGFLALGSDGGEGRREEARVSSWMSGPNILRYCASAGLRCGLEREAGCCGVSGRQPSPRLSSLGAGTVCSSGLHGSRPFIQPCRPPWELPFLSLQSVSSWVAGVGSGSARGPPSLVRGPWVGILCVRTVCGPLPAAPNSGRHRHARVSLPPFSGSHPGREVRHRAESGVLLPCGWGSAADHS